MGFYTKHIQYALYFCSYTSNKTFGRFLFQTCHRYYYITKDDFKNDTQRSHGMNLLCYQAYTCSGWPVADFWKEYRVGIFLLIYVELNIT